MDYSSWLHRSVGRAALDRGLAWRADTVLSRFLMAAVVILVHRPCKSTEGVDELVASLQSLILDEHARHCELHVYWCSKQSTPIAINASHLMRNSFHVASIAVRTFTSDHVMFGASRSFGKHYVFSLRAGTVFHTPFHLYHAVHELNTVPWLGAIRIGTHNGSVSDGAWGLLPPFPVVFRRLQYPPPLWAETRFPQTAPPVPGSESYWVMYSFRYVYYKDFNVSLIPESSSPEEGGTLQCAKLQARDICDIRKNLIWNCPLQPISAGLALLPQETPCDPVAAKGKGDAVSAYVKSKVTIVITFGPTTNTFKYAEPTSIVMSSLNFAPDCREANLLFISQSIPRGRHCQREPGLQETLNDTRNCIRRSYPDAQYIVYDGSMMMLELLALEHSKTEYTFFLQDDFVHNVPFSCAAHIQVMEAHPNLQYIGFVYVPGVNTPPSQLPKLVAQYRNAEDVNDANHFIRTRIRKQLPKRRVQFCRKHKLCSFEACFQTWFNLSLSLNPGWKGIHPPLIHIDGRDHYTNLSVHLEYVRQGKPIPPNLTESDFAMSVGHKFLNRSIWDKYHLGVGPARQRYLQRVCSVDARM